MLTTVRRHLRLLATLWLVLQAATLSAFVPRDCCQAHRPAADAPHCVETAGAAPESAAQTPDGDRREDVVRRACGAPPVFALFATPGIVTATAMPVVPVSASPVSLPRDEPPVDRTRPPTDRPPRA